MLSSHAAELAGDRAVRVGAGRGASAWGTPVALLLALSISSRSCTVDGSNVASRRDCSQVRHRSPREPFSATPPVRVLDRMRELPHSARGDFRVHRLPGARSQAGGRPPASRARCPHGDRDVDDRPAGRARRWGPRDRGRGRVLRAARAPKMSAPRRRSARGIDPNVALLRIRRSSRVHRPAC